MKIESDPNSALFDREPGLHVDVESTSVAADLEPNASAGRRQHAKHRRTSCLEGGGLPIDFSDLVSHADARGVSGCSWTNDPDSKGAASIWRYADAEGVL